MHSGVNLETLKVHIWIFMKHTWGNWHVNLCEPGLLTGTYHPCYANAVILYIYDIIVLYISHEIFNKNDECQHFVLHMAFICLIFIFIFTWEKNIYSTLHIISECSLVAHTLGKGLIGNEKICEALNFNIFFWPWTWLGTVCSAAKMKKKKTYQ